MGRIRTLVTLAGSLGVKWSQVQILSARPEKPALTSVGAGFFVSLGLDGQEPVSQAISSVPSDFQWANRQPRKRGASGAQVLALSVGIDRQAIPWILAVPCCDHGEPTTSLRLTLVLQRPLSRKRLPVRNSGRWGHNPEVAGSNPVPATSGNGPRRSLRGPFSCSLGTYWEHLALASD
jgi:hypothetical protein